MPKIWEQEGFRFYLYLNDHRPSHVHVRKAEGEAIVFLGDDHSTPSLREVRGMSVRDVKKVLDIAARQQRRLLSAWRRIHGKEQAE